MERYQLNPEQAFELLRNQARSRRRKVVDMAVEIIGENQYAYELKPDSNNH